MGRKSLPMKPIEDKVNRQVTFCKRRSGLFKKAQDLSTLCHAVVGLILFSESGRMYEFSSGQRIIERYQSHTKEKGKEPMDCGEAEEQRAGSDKATFDLLAIVESILQQRSVPQIIQLEEQLQASLLRTRSTKTELMMESWQDFQQQQVAKLKEENRAIKEEKTVLKEENTVLKEENIALKEEVAVGKNSRNEEGTSSLPKQPHLLELL